MILSLDIGTSSTRAILYDTENGLAVPGATAAIAHDPDATMDGGSTLDPEALLEEAVSCAERVLAGRSEKVHGVAVTTFWHSIVGVDAAGKPLTPVLLWSDRRAAPQVARLRQEMDPAAYTQRTGCLLHTSYALGKLRWLAETQPETLAACTRIVSPGEYLFGRLFGWGGFGCSVSMASASGLMDQAKGGWDEETLRHVPGMRAELLAEIGDAPAQGLVAPFRERLPALADVPWFPALGDGACSNLGCGAVTPDRLALMIGTSGALRACVGDALPAVPTGLWRYRADGARTLVGGALSNGGSVWAWLTETLRLPGLPKKELDAALGALPPDGCGLTVLPFFQGERAPGWRDDARAAIVGLSAATSSLEIARAALEAVAYRFAVLRELLRPVAPSAALVGTGAGLLASRAWAQIIADVLQEPILLSAEEQASSRGAALWAREKLGLGTIESAPFDVQTHVEPNAAHADVYRAARERHADLYRKLM